jgi:hypothetical protein
MALSEERERTAKEEERRRQDQARLEAEERRRIEQLEKQASTWSLASSIRQFVEAVRQEATSRKIAFEPEGPLDYWLRWAERHAASIDPVATVLAGMNPAKNGS